MHALGEVHRHLTYLGTQIPVNPEKCIHDIIHLSAADDGNQCSLATMSILVGDYGVQLAVAERGLIYAHVGADVVRENKPLVGVLLFFPILVAAQVLFVLALKLMTICVVVSLK